MEGREFKPNSGASEEVSHTLWGCERVKLLSFVMHQSAPADEMMRLRKQNRDGVKTGKTGNSNPRLCFPSGGGNVQIRHLL